MQDRLTGRGIKYLVHFTKYSNFPSIMINGLLRRTELDRRGLCYNFNDDMRLDRHPETLSVSIGFPNYKMFYRARQDYADDTWVVLFLHPNVLIQKPCAYYARNAATGCYKDTNPQSLQNKASFDAMFSDIGPVKRSDLGIPDHFTTDPQAEVLVFADIESKYIIGVGAQNDAQRAEILYNYTRFKDKSVQSLPQLFKPREDYEHWT
ncbi:DarT ssDNA thymidine ADP-ribosyltransferase family protein [Cohaesibacter marisflavi]|uniref:DarT ssDNA thymidine ADP-ribosyltransferase family protein n=1 Tax=Cohaesibacter marisflavi TaxID=655353 RepID=UPI0029C763BD|nr:DarT ssDNA thymidine ADP-ribosyltransferase family protein [Cohaesibacter marisflavi]